MAQLEEDLAAARDAADEVSAAANQAMDDASAAAGDAVDELNAATAAALGAAGATAAAAMDDGDDCTLGIEVGDFIACHSRPEVLDNGYIVGRNLDNKAGVAAVLVAMRNVEERFDSEKNRFTGAAMLGAKRR